jgi:hypothetical protein
VNTSEEKINTSVEKELDKENLSIEKEKEKEETSENNELLNEIKDIITNNNVKNENIVFNIKKINNTYENDDNTKMNEEININNIFENITENELIGENKSIGINKSNDSYMNINFYNKKYIVKILKIISSNLNMYNLHKAKILKENIIQNDKLSLLLENNNSSYLLNYFNNLFLFNKVNNNLLITNLKNKKTMILSDNKFFKLFNYNFYLTFDCRLIVPIVNKKIFNNQNGSSINYFEPNI